MKVLFFIIFTFLLSVSVSIAQTKESSTMDLLMGATWEHTLELPGNEIFELEYIFTSTTITNITTYNSSESGEILFTYYLSDEPTFEFDDSKVGKVKGGSILFIKISSQKFL